MNTDLMWSMTVTADSRMFYISARRSRRALTIGACLLVSLDNVRDETVFKWRALFCQEGADSSCGSTAHLNTTSYEGYGTFSW